MRMNRAYGSDACNQLLFYILRLFRFILFYFISSGAANTVRRALETCSSDNLIDAVGGKQEPGMVDNFCRRKEYWELLKEKEMKESKVR